MAQAAQHYRVVIIGGGTAGICVAARLRRLGVRRKFLFAEFDYTGKPAPSVPGIDTMRERTDFGLFKRYGLPALYWNGMLRRLS